MKAIRNAVGPGGIFMLYEPTRRAGEDRAAFLERFERTNKVLWSVLTPRPNGIRFGTTSAPATSRRRRPGWCELGRNAGFREARQVFVDPTDFFRLFRYEA